MNREADMALRVTVAESFAEVVGATLMQRLGFFAEEPVDPSGDVTLVFYPEHKAPLSTEDLLALLPTATKAEGAVRFERREVPRDWVDGWKEHFRPIRIGRVRVRPPWELPSELSVEGGAAGAQPSRRTADRDRDSTVDVVINPGLGFGTGLHPTTRGTLTLLQEEHSRRGGAGLSPGRLVDAGTGSGILSVAAAKLGWGPILAFDNDPVALTAARENLKINGVADVVEVRECGVEEADAAWFNGAVVLANMTLDPVLTLLRRLVAAEDATAACADRLVVSGVLAGPQEERLAAEAQRCGYLPGSRLYEGEWVSMEIRPKGARADAAPARIEDGAEASGVSTAEGV